jgi:PepSY-associated TM region
VIRKALFWLHLSAGGTAGSFIFIMAVTGVMLAFERQVIAFVDRDLRFVTNPRTPSRGRYAIFSQQFAAPIWVTRLPLPYAMSLKLPQSFPSAGRRQFMSIHTVALFWVRVPPTPMITFLQSSDCIGRSVLRLDRRRPVVGSQRSLIFCSLR